MTLYFQARRALISAALVVLLPFGMATAQEASGVNEVNPAEGFSSVSRAFSSMDKQYSRIGTPRSISQVRRMAVGLSQSELHAALGTPAIKYGDGSLEFHLSLPLTGRDRLICQYRVFLDEQNTVERAVWRRPQCADLVVGRVN